MDSVKCAPSDGKGKSLPSLPEQLWKKIICNLFSLDDLRNAARTCKDWKRILSEQRILWGFPDVLPNLALYLSRNDTLNCRAVCRCWSQAIDEYFERCSDSDSSYISVGKSKIVKIFWRKTDDNYPYVIGCENNVIWDGEWWDPGWKLFKGWRKDSRGYWHWPGPDQWIRSLRNKTRNPFIGRHLKVQYCSWSHTWSHEDINNFILFFGNHLWYLDIHFSENVFFPEMCTLVCNALQNAPNLRQLRIIAEQSLRVENCGSLQISSGSDVDHLATPVPTLRILQIPFLEDNSALLIHFLVRNYSIQLYKIETAMWDVTWSELEWRNLKDLQINFANYTIFRSIVEQPDVSKMNAPVLKRLKLSFPICSDNDNLTATESFQSAVTSTNLSLLPILNLFSTVCEVSLSFPNFTTADSLTTTRTSDNLHQQFPQPQPQKCLSIKRLTLNCLPISKTFLIHFSELEHLNIIPVGRVYSRLWWDPILYENYEPDNHILRSARIGRLKRISQSEVWELLPSLKQIHILNEHESNLHLLHSCSRKDYKDSIIA